MDTISVVVPIYNAAQYLEESVNSILKQTYNNLQIILVNDGSTDSSWDLCKKLENYDSRVTAVTQENRGVSVARNRGIDLASGEWIMFVDPDDILDKNIVLTLLHESSDNIDIMMSACYGVNSNIKKRAHFFEEDRTFRNKKLDLYLQLLDNTYAQSGEIFTGIGVPWGKLYRRSFLKNYNLKFDPSLRRMQDNIFNMYAFYYAQKIKYIDRPLYYYRLENISDYEKRNKKNYEKIFKPVIEERYKALEKLNLYSNPKIYQSYINESANMFINIINNRILEDRRMNIKELKNKDYFRDLYANRSLLNSKKVRIKLKLIEMGIYAPIYKVLNKEE